MNGNNYFLASFQIGRKLQLMLIELFIFQREKRIYLETKENI